MKTLLSALLALDKVKARRRDAEVKPSYKHSDGAITIYEGFNLVNRMLHGGPRAFLSSLLNATLNLLCRWVSQIHAWSSPCAHPIPGSVSFVVVK